MNSTSREEAVAYLLDELDAPARARFEARLARDAELQSDVAALRGVVHRLDRLDAAAWSPPDPPPPPPPPPSVASAPRELARLRPSSRLAMPVWGLAALTCGLLGLAVVLGVSLSGRDSNRTAIVLEPVGAGGDASGRVDLANDEAVVEIEGLPAVSQGDYYELWLLTSPTDLVSLGSFRVTESGEAEMRVPVPVDPQSFRYLDVSLEPGDGDPGHSQRSVLRAAIAG